MRAQSKARSATDSITPLPFFWTGHPRYRNLDGQRLAIEKAHRFALQRKVQRKINPRDANATKSFALHLRGNRLVFGGGFALAGGYYQHRAGRMSQHGLRGGTH